MDHDEGAFAALRPGITFVVVDLTLFDVGEAPADSCHVDPSLCELCARNNIKHPPPLTPPRRFCRSDSRVRAERDLFCGGGHVRSPSPLLICKSDSRAQAGHDLFCGKAGMGVDGAGIKPTPGARPRRSCRRDGRRDHRSRRRRPRSVPRCRPVPARNAPSVRPCGR